MVHGGGVKKVRIRLVAHLGTPELRYFCQTREEIIDLLWACHTSNAILAVENPNIKEAAQEVTKYFVIKLHEDIEWKLAQKDGSAQILTNSSIRLLQLMLAHGLKIYRWQIAKTANDLRNSCRPETRDVWHMMRNHDISSAFFHNSHEDNYDVEMQLLVEAPRSRKIKEIKPR